MRKKQKNLRIFIIIKVIIMLIFIGLVFKYATNYEKNDAYVKNKINLIINNNNVTKSLKYDLFINEKEVIYMSKKDIENFFDGNIMYEEESNQIITTYGEKIATLPIDKNMLTINDSKVDLLSGAIKKDGEYYLPISAMSKVYNVDIDYIREKEILTLDSLDRKLIKADVSKKSNIKFKTTIFSKSVDKVKRAEKVICIQEVNNKWTKIRTNDGKIGYIKSKYLVNEICVRENLVKETNTEKINMIWDYYSEYVSAPNRNGTTINGVNVVSPSFFSLKSKGNGEIINNVGTEGIEYINWAKSNNYKVWAMFSNNAYKETTSSILKNYESRKKVINNIVKLAITYELDGINLDFENMYTDDKELFSRFVIELKPKLEEAGIILSVDVIAPDGGGNWSECFDRNKIGKVADYIVFMAYDQYGTGSTSAGTTAGYNWVETGLKKFINREEVSANKIILGIPFYTRLWTENENGTVSSRTVNMNDIDIILPNNVTRQWNEELKQYYVEYTKDNKRYKMWLEETDSIKCKLDLVNKYDLAGVAFWEKDREDEEIWDIVKDKLNLK